MSFPFSSPTLGTRLLLSFSVGTGPGPDCCGGGWTERDWNLRWWEDVRVAEDVGDFFDRDRGHGETGGQSGVVDGDVGVLFHVVLQLSLGLDPGR